MDVKENDKEYLVHADIPGMKREDIKVTADNNILTISAQRDFETTDKSDDKEVTPMSHNGMELQFVFN